MEKRKKQQPEEQMSEYEKKYRALKMREEVKNTAERTRKQMDKEWARYKEAKKIVDQKKADAAKAELEGNQGAKDSALKMAEIKAKEANEAFKMARFFMRMHELAQRFMMMLERVQSIDELFNILSGTQQMFHAILGQKNDKVTKSMKKDLRKFKKKLADYEAQMEELLEYIDSIFDEKPNLFTRFCNWIKRKPAKSALDVLEANEASFLQQMESYQIENSEEVSGGSTPTPTAGGDEDFGAF